MRVTQLSFENFRNLSRATLIPHPRFNVLVGRNGQGKTNVLEAIFLIAALRGMRGGRNGDMIRWGEMTASLSAAVLRRSVSRTLDVQLDRSGRRVSLDGKRLNRLSEYFGHFNVVLFVPEDLAMTKGEPALRRRFLDRAIFNEDPAHLELLRNFELALRQRNALLRQGHGPHAAALVAAFDAPFARLSAEVVLRRLAWLEVVTPLIQDVHRVVATAANGGEGVEVAPDGADGGDTIPELALGYRCSLGADATAVLATGPSAAAEALSAAFAARLQDRLESDLERGFTSIGPHADDLEFRLGGVAVRRFASQGQHRSIVLACKIAEIRHLQACHGVRPILLLDDVSSELDPGRRDRLLSLVLAEGGQVFLTTTHPQWLPPAISAEGALWHVADGRITAVVGGGWSTPADAATDSASHREDVP